MSLSVVRDRPSRLRAYGIDAPLHVSVAGGERVRAPEWSHLGLVLPVDAIPPLDGGLVHLVLHIDYQGFQIDVPARAVVDETGESPPGPGRVRLEFVELDGRGRDLVSRFVDDYVRGRTVEADGALLSLDAPHDPISVKPDAAPRTARRALRPVLMTALYVAIGLATFAYLGVLIWAHSVRLEVRAAVVTRPIEVVRTNDDGTILSVHAAEGERMGVGGLVARMADPRLEERIARAVASVETAANATRRARRRVGIDERRIADYQLLWEAERRALGKEIDKRRRDWLKALTTFRRSLALWDENARGTTSKWRTVRLPLGWAWNENEWGRACLGRLKPREVADIMALRAMYPRPQTMKDMRKVEIVPCAVFVARYRRTVELRLALRDARNDAKRQSKIDGVSERRLFNGREFVVDLDVSILERDKAKAREAEARALVEALRAQRTRADIRSARGGRLIELAVAPGMSVTKATTVAVIERDVAPSVAAYLTQEEVGQVGMGDRAEVFLPAIDGAVQGTVTRIDRAAGHRDDRTSLHVWREDGARSALVVLALDAGELGDAIVTGLPATVLFERRSPGFLRRRAVEDVVDRARGIVPSEIVPSEIVPSEIVPSETVPSEIVPSLPTPVPMQGPPPPRGPGEDAGDVPVAALPDYDGVDALARVVPASGPGASGIGPHP